MKRKYDSQLFLEELNKAIREKENNLDFPQIVYHALETGVSSQQQHEKTEIKKFDDHWLKNIEAYFPSLDKITRNLRSNLKYESEILPVEKTRRTNPESIRHLVQNTQYIRDIQDDHIIPDKVLNTLSEIDYGIYENRFIMTLILRLKDYLYNRLEILKEEVNGFKESKLDLENQFSFNNAQYDLTIQLKAKEVLSPDEEDTHNRSVLYRTEKLYHLVSKMATNDFMQTMKKYKPVTPPIMKTQVILKNPDFKNAYMLWLYLDKTHELEYDLSIDQKEHQFPEAYYGPLNQSLLVLFTTMFNYANLGSGLLESEIKATYKPERKLSYATNVTDFENYDLEPQEASEYYLDQAKKLFEQNYEQRIKETSNKKESLQKILIEQYSIINKIYENYFEINQDQDVFSKLIQANDSKKAFNEALEKYEIAKIVREVKEKMYVDSLILEEKWQEQIEEKHQLVLKDLETLEIENTEKLISEHQNKLNLEQLAYQKKLNRDKTIAYNKQKVLTDIKIRELQFKYDAELSKIKEVEKRRLMKEKEKQKAQLLKQKAQLREKNKLEKEKQKEKFELSIKKQKEKLDKLKEM